MANQVTDPRLQVFLEGRGQVTNLTYTDFFSTDGKGENTLKIKSTDGFKDLMLTGVNMGTIQKIILNITPTVASDPDPEVIMRVTLNTGGPDFDYDLGCSRLFIWQPSLTYAPYVKNIQISTTSVNYIKVDVRIYGGS
jgi:hypothetical protein